MLQHQWGNLTYGFNNNKWYNPNKINHNKPMCKYYGLYCSNFEINLSYKSHNPPVPYPTLHHFQQNCGHVSVLKWHIVPLCTILQHNSAHVCTFLLQSGEFWNIWCIMRFVRWVYQLTLCSPTLYDSYQFCQLTALGLCRPVIPHYWLYIQNPRR